MADYRCSIKPRLGRGKGASVARTAAYITRGKLEDARTGELYDYSGARDRALWTGIYAPKNAPAWAQDLQKLTNAIEHAEKRKDSQLGLPVELSLSHELTVEQNRWMMQDFIRENFTRHGYAAIAAIHEPPHGGDPRNIHAHLLVTLRGIDENGFAKTKAEQQENYMARRERVEVLRQSWEKHLKQHLNRHGFEKEAQEVSCKSLKERGIDRDPQQHLGPTASDMERKGKKTKRGDLNRETGERNEQLAQLKAAEKKLSQAISDAEKQLKEETRQRKTESHKKEGKEQRQQKGADASLPRREHEKLERGRIRLDRVQEKAEPSKIRQAAKSADAADKGVTKAVNVAGRLTSGFMKGVDRALDFLVGAPPPRKYTAIDIARDAEAARQHYAQQAATQKAAQQRNGVLDRWSEQLKESDNDFSALSPADLQHLNKIDLQNIKARGEETILGLLEERERQRYRDMGWERERER